MLRGHRVVTGLGLLMCLTSASAAGQQADTTTASRAGSALGFAAKVGVGFEPSQFVVGLQYSLGKTLGLFRLVPNGHVGFGDQTTFDFSLDFLLRGVLDSGLGLYGGAAPTVVIGEDNTEVGATLVGGIQLPLLKDRATNLEARFGIGDVPEFRLLGVIVF